MNGERAEPLVRQGSGRRPNPPEHEDCPVRAELPERRGRAEGTEFPERRDCAERAGLSGWPGRTERPRLPVPPESGQFSDLPDLSERSQLPEPLEPSGCPGGSGRAAAGCELSARVLLTRVLEPGDASGGRWVRELGAVAVARRLRDGGPRLAGFSDKRWAGLCARAAQSDPARDLAAARAAGVRFVCPGTPEWPAQLDDLGDARPLGLWVRGRPSLRLWALRSVAVVGARACTEYGAHMAAHLAAGLADRGWVVVSGGAYGVDGAAHRGALGSSGATVAVLACGVDRPYPRGHAALIDRIAEQGLVVGELPPGDHPTPSRFVVRNRVIAALTRGTVVVEAAYRSGSLATARAAQRLGRHTMGVPTPLSGRTALAPIRFRLATAA